MRRFMHPKWLVPLTLLLVVMGIALGVGVQRLTGQETPRAGEVVVEKQGRLSELQKDAPFTLYAPARLPEGFVEAFSYLREDADGTVLVNTDYRNDALRSIVTVLQTTTPIRPSKAQEEASTTVVIDGRPVRMRPGDAEGRPDIVVFTWQHGDVYISVPVMMGEGMSKEDFFPVIASFAPVSAQAPPEQ